MFQQQSRYYQRDNETELMQGCSFHSSKSTSNYIIAFETRQTYLKVEVLREVLDSCPKLCFNSLVKLDGIDAKIEILNWTIELEMRDRYVLSLDPSHDEHTGYT